jgi:hypothetical protein
MAQFSTPLLSLCTGKTTGTSTAFEPDYLYLIKFPRMWSGPILGLALRAPTGGGTVILTLVSDEKGQPNEVVFKTELPVPQGKDSAGHTTLIATFEEPLTAYDTFWLGLRFSAPVELPLHLPSFAGKRTAATIDFARISGSLLNTAMEDVPNDPRLGLPLLFPILVESLAGVDHAV